MARELLIEIEKLFNFGVKEKQMKEKLINDNMIYDRGKQILDDLKQKTYLWYSFQGF